MKSRHFYILFLLLLALPNRLSSQIIKENYVQSTMFLDKNGTNKLTEIQYYDGLGRPIQRAAFGINTSGKYVHYSQDYDTRGRLIKDYLPVVGEAIPDFVGKYSYRDKMQSTYGDTCAYTNYEYDVTSRKVSTMKAGAAWHNNDKLIETNYVTNAANSVKRYEAPLDKISLVKNGYYAANTLYGEERIDEDGHQTVVFKDKLGRVVLERRNGNNDTYYVYNILGQLRYVLSPEYQNSGYKDLYAYEYRYDSKGRCVKKIFPSCEYIQYWYDNADRPIFMQDARLRSEGLYRFMLYDNQGRISIEGVCSSCNRGETINTATYTGTSQSFGSTGYILKFANLITNPIIEKAYYYDNYNFINTYSAKCPILADSLRLTSSNNATGLNTGYIEIASNGEMLVDVIYYDNKGRKSSSRSLTLGKRYISSTISYTYKGDVKQTRIAEYRTNANQPILQLQSTQTNHYDISSGKLSSTTLTVGSGNTEQSRTIQSFVYDDLGRVIKNTRSGNAGAVEYEYNLHGWITKLSGRGYEEELFYTEGNGTPYYSGNISSRLWTTDNGGLYRGYIYTYDKLNRLTRAQYGEHRDISDNPNRYTEAVLAYSANGAIERIQRHGLKNDGVYGKVDNLNIELNGNQIQKITDDALPVYLADAVDFDDGADLSTEYTYNGNGALVSDANKGIAYIEYDRRNYLQKIQFTNGNTIRYIYSPSGKKLRTIYVTAINNIIVPLGSTVELSGTQILTVDSTDYSGGIIYKNNIAKRLLFEGGYVDLGATPAFRYYTKDFQGNNRVVCDESGNILQTVHYYPFGGVYADAGNGASVQPYKLGGKELDRMHGLDWYDFSARSYDATTMRWTAIDPLAEKFYHISPYTYCLNNPISYIDEDGKVPIINIVGAFLGAGTEYFLQVAKNQPSDNLVERYTDIDWLDVGIAATEGFLTSGSSVVRRSAARTSISIGSSIISSTFDYKDNDFSLNEKFMEDNINGLKKETTLWTAERMLRLHKLKVNKTTEVVRKTHHTFNKKFDGDKARKTQTLIKRYNEQTEKVNDALSTYAFPFIYDITNTKKTDDEEEQEKEWQ